MNPNPLFDDLQHILLSQGLPRASARRYLQELADHREDLLLELQQSNITPSEAQRLADERLGPVDMLAQAAIATYRSRTFMGRHPRLFFAALPFLLVPVYLCLFIIVFIVPFTLTGFFANGVPPHLQPLLLTLFWCFKYGAPAIIGILYYRAARRRALSRAFRISASAAAILWACFFNYYLSFQHPGPHGQLSIGVGVYPHPTQALAVTAAILLYARFIQQHSLKPVLTA